MAVSDAELDDPRDRLSCTRFGPSFADEDWEEGAPRPWSLELVRYWLRTQRALNALLR
ncbi:epoxide hydrolase N-terminal domain-containing protein [Prauserella marina]|uniref:epoxide hydrolase N-terminal domain-containing protein n=1 Tax=Prauserella marina TaxID=530584 RepID=UPI000B861746